MAIDSVPLLDLTRDTELLAEVRSAVGRVVDSGRYVLGPEGASLERELAEYLRIDHALGVSSGTDALLLAMMSVGVEDGDEVICPTYTFFATAGSIWRLGAKPVFVDCDPLTLNSSHELLAAAITDRTKAIVPVHLFGLVTELQPLAEVAAERGIAIIEDAAQAIGALGPEGYAGTVGTMGCFSFFPTKNLGGVGDGGLLITGDSDLAERARVLRVHGSEPKYYHHMVGGCFRLDELQAAALRVKLGRLDAANEARRANAARYGEQLIESGVAIPVDRAESAADPRIRLPIDFWAQHTYHQYVVRVPGDGRRDALRAFLQERKVGCEIYYPIPLHLQSCFESLGWKSGDFPVAEQAARESLALPVFSDLTEAEIDHVAANIAEWYAR